MSRRRSILAMVGAAATAACVASACSDPFPRIPNGKSLVVTLVPNPDDGGIPNLGTEANPLALSIQTPMPFSYSIRAIAEDGGLDTTFNGFVRASVQPGNVLSLSGPADNPTLDGGIVGRNVQLHNGIVDAVTVNITQAYGGARIWFEDLGYEPADPLGTVPPECSNGIDDNHNGLIDFPADPGCYAANDNTEDLGAYASGEGPAIFIALPRIQDVRGYNPSEFEFGTATAFPDDQVTIDTGYRGENVPQKFSVVVTAIAAEGLFLQDLQQDYLENPPGYNGIYAFTLSAPQNVNVCDQLTALSGTSADYYGFTELNYPTWEVQPWDPQLGPCPVPVVPPAMTQAVISSGLFQYESALVRVGLDDAGTSIRIPDNFGPGFPDAASGYAPGPEATDCDFNGDGKIEFTGGAEQQCDEACVNSGDCSEYSAYTSEQEFTLYVTTAGKTASILVNGASSATFSPVQMRGQTLGAVTGNLMYFSGGSAWTIVARCADDIVLSPNGAPVPGNVACIFTSGIDNNAGQ